MKKVAVWALVLMLVLSVACPAVAADDLYFVTGGSRGIYYAYGGVLASVITDNTDLNIVVGTGEGSAANIDMLDMNFAQLALVQSDIASYAYNGIRFEQYIDYPVTSFSALAALYTESVQLVTCNPEIKSVEDLRGKNVSIGSAGSSVYFNAMDFLAAYGMTVEDIVPQYLSFEDSTEPMKNGKIQAAFIVSAAPAAAVQNLCKNSGARLIGLDEAAIAKLQKMNSFYTASLIPGGTYEGINKDVLTVGVKATLIASEEVTEEQAYAIVSTIFENKAAIAAMHAKGADLDAEYASSCGIPYHAGALRYYDEYTKTSIVHLPEGLKEIKSLAFENCAEIRCIYIPEDVKEIAVDAFANCREDLVILGSSGSAAEAFATAHGYQFRIYVP